MPAKPSNVWRFYVYAFFEDGAWAYVGKGSSDRFKAQRNRFNLPGHEVARFKTESQAYAFERELISANKPFLNKCPGGGGSRAIPVRTLPLPKEFIEIESVGVRRYAAMILWRYRYMFTPEQLIPVRQLLGAC